MLAWLVAFSDSISLKGELLLLYRAVLYCCFAYVGQLASVLLTLALTSGDLFGSEFLCVFCC